MPSYDPAENNFKSLSAQIREAEMQVLERQRTVIDCAGMLMQKTQQRMIAPSNLLLAGGIGFIIGELMKLRSSHSPSHAHAKDSAGTAGTPITGIVLDALNMVNTISSLYTAVRASSSKTGEARADD